jgi:hypothetical protein
MAAKILKLTIPGLHQGSSLQQYLDKSNPLLKQWRIELNNPNLEFADAWCIIENTNSQDNYCKVARSNTFFFAAETAQNLGHIEEVDSMKKFLSQFSHVYTYHQYFGSGGVAQPPFLPWMINANHGESMFNHHDRDVSFFQNLNDLTKTKLISVICSTQGLTPGHKMRLRFVEQLQRHFSSDLDWYGNGLNPVSEKWDAIAPYKYTIALENQSRHNVITEKLGDSFLALSYPFYWGAPNANQFFSQDGFTHINIEDFEGSVKIIEEVIRADTYLNKMPAIIENKNKVIHEFNFLNRIIQVCESRNVNEEPVSMTLKSVQEFELTGIKLHNALVGSIQRTLNGLDSKLGTNFVDIAGEIYILFRYNKIARKFSSYLNK